VVVSENAFGRMDTAEGKMKDSKKKATLPYMDERVTFFSISFVFG
jgi:hypothetical protein